MLRKPRGRPLTPNDLMTRLSECRYLPAWARQGATENAKKADDWGFVERWIKSMERKAASSISHRYEHDVAARVIYLLVEPLIWGIRKLASQGTRRRAPAPLNLCFHCHRDARVFTSWGNWRDLPVCARHAPGTPGGRHAKRLMQWAGGPQELAMRYKSDRQSVEEEYRKDVYRMRVEGGRLGGAQGGRPLNEYDDEVARAKVLISEGLSIRAAADRVGINRSTLSRRLRLP